MTPSSTLPKSLEPLVSTPSIPDIGPGPRSSVLPVVELESQIKRLVQEGMPTGDHRPSLVLCVALIWNDHWIKAHELAQDIDNADGSLLHAIVHRREPDYSNAKYWLRRARNHPALPQVSKALLDHFSCETPAARGISESWLQNGCFEPESFVDAVDRAIRKSDSAEQKVLAQAQAIELTALLRYFAMHCSQ